EREPDARRPEPARDADQAPGGAREPGPGGGAALGSGPGLAPAREPEEPRVGRLVPRAGRPPGRPLRGRGARRRFTLLAREADALHQPQALRVAGARDERAVELRADARSGQPSGRRAIG